MKKKLALVTGVVTLALVGAVVAATQPDSTGATDSPIVDQVNRQEQELANHDARITNTENDVKDLQGNTNTAPSTVRVEVPAKPASLANTPASNPGTQSTPAESGEPNPVTVTAYEKIPDGNDIICKLTYSDGSTSQRKWQTTNPQGAWIEDGQGQNGHWQATTTTSGNCDDTLLGTIKG